MSQRQPSDLRVFKIEPRDEAHTWWKPSKFCSISPPGGDGGRASICLISKVVLDDVRLIAPNRPCLMRAMPGKGSVSLICFAWSL